MEKQVLDADNQQREAARILAQTKQNSLSNLLGECQPTKIHPVSWARRQARLHNGSSELAAALQLPASSLSISGFSLRRAE